MTEHKQPEKENADPIKAPFTSEQEARLREIIRDEIAIREKQLIHERRFGAPYRPKEVK